MAAILAIIGAAVFLLLGLGHAVFTLQSRPDGGPMMPTNPATRAAMQVPGGIGLEPELDQAMYPSWIGFNLSHSLGVIAIAAIVLWHAIDDFGAALGEPWFIVLIALAPPAYIVLAIRYWFAKPRDAIIFGTLILWAGALIELV